MSGWRALRDLPRPIAVLFVATLINRLGTMAMPFLVLYLTRQLGWSAPAAAALLSAYGATALVAGPLSGRLVDRVGVHRMMVVALGSAGAIQLVYPWLTSTVSVVLATVAWAAMSEGYRPAAMSAVALYTPAEQRRSAYAAIRLAINLGMSVGPAVGGFLFAVSFPAVFVVDGATSVA